MVPSEYLPFCQRINTVPQRQQTPINVGSFPEALTSILRHCGAFRACQIDERHLGNTDVSLHAGSARLLSHEYLEDCVRARRLGVGVGRMLGAVLVAKLEHLEQILSVFWLKKKREKAKKLLLFLLLFERQYPDLMQSETSHSDATTSILTDWQILARN